MNVPNILAASEAPVTPTQKLARIFLAAAPAVDVPP